MRKVLLTVALFTVMAVGCVRSAEAHIGPVHPVITPIFAGTSHTLPVLLQALDAAGAVGAGVELFAAPYEVAYTENPLCDWIGCFSSDGRPFVHTHGYWHPQD